MPGIFISYRRTDNPDATGRIYDRLVSEFGKVRVFKDVDSIPLGQDFRAHLNEIVGGCAAVLAIIGPRWTDMRDTAGARRLDDADDFVRIELEAALARNIPVVPVLVAHAAMPATRELPASLASLAFRQAIEVRPDPDFHNDATRLVAALRKIIDPGSAETPDVPTAIKADTASRAPLARWGWVSAAIAALAAIGLSIPAMKHLGQSPPAEIRLDIATPETSRPQDFALSPDGRQIVYVARDASVERLWLRALDSATAQPLAGTEGAMRPFWSPDSRSIAWFTTNALMRLDIGGVPRLITRINTVVPDSGTWNEHGQILFVPSPIVGGLLEVAAAGGEARKIELKDAQQGVITTPRFLPGGGQFLWSFVGYTAADAAIYLTTPETGETTRLETQGSLAGFLPPHWVFIAREDGLIARRLDLRSRSLVGEVIPIANGAGSVSSSGTGLLAVRRAPARLRQLQWFDRSGQFIESWGEPQSDYTNMPRVSPDGSRVAVNRTIDRNQDVWLVDRQRATRITFNPLADAQPIWTPDGAELIYSSLSKDGFSMRRKASSGAGEETSIGRRAGRPGSYPLMIASSVSPDGRFVLSTSLVSVSGTSDLYVTPLTESAAPAPWLQTPFNENSAAFSPDGEWVAYESNDSGKPEVYVRPFGVSAVNANPDPVEDVRWQISINGGTAPRWGRDSGELFFVNASGDLTVAAIAPKDDSLVIGKVEVLLKRALPGSESVGTLAYDIGPGDRILMLRDVDTGGVPPITLIQNWDPERVAKQ